jgi:uncharacterized membrane protein YbhN (UPF0104 family)
LAAAILFFIGRQFARDLKSADLWQFSIRPAWLVLAGGLYLAGLGFSTLFWVRLLRRLGQRPTVPAAIRAYYLGHLGKYLPGKAWALALRAGLVRAPQVRVGVAGVTALYEVLTTMAAGAGFAAGWFLTRWPNTSAPPDWQSLRRLIRLQDPGPAALDPRLLAALALVLLAVVFFPVVPEIFNRLCRRLRALVQDASAPALPSVPWSLLVQGLILTAGGWLFLGASVWAIVQALVVVPLPLTWTLWARYTAYLALAYVAGFVILVVPSGLGVREFFLTLLLTPDLGADLGRDEPDPRALAVLAVLLLRVVWTAAELVMASVVYWLPRPAWTEPAAASAGRSAPEGHAP